METGFDVNLVRGCLDGLWISVSEERLRSGNRWELESRAVSGEDAHWSLEQG